MGLALTTEQEFILEQAIRWYRNSPEQVFQISGNPGTGKSFLINVIVSALGLEPSRVACMAYTGSASLVMRMKGFRNAKTIHSWIYDVIEEPMRDKYGYPVMDKLFNTPIMELHYVVRKLENIDLIVIDEAGMVPQSMKKDIESQGIKILVTGDLDQLPPVADRPAYLYNGVIYTLSQIMRQAEGNAIIYLSQRAKQGLPINSGLYGNDVLVIPEEDLTGQMIMNSNVILCGKNTTRDRFNNLIRYQYLGKNSEIPDFNEKVIFRKNSWSVEQNGINITNGLKGIVYNRPDVASYDGNCFNIDFLPDLSPVEESIFRNVKIDYKYFTADYENKKLIRSNRYNPGEKLEFAYALTTHLSQGSQYPAGLYYMEYLNKDINNALNYTAITRFSQKAIIVKPRQKKYVNGIERKE